MDIYTTAVVISLVIYIAIGNYAGRSIRHLDDYYVAGRRAPTLLIVGTLVASLMSTNAFLGETGFAYETQAGAFIAFPPTGCLGYIYGALFFGRYLRRSRALTVADYFGQRFNSHRVQSAAGLTIVLALGGYLLAVTQGAAVILADLTGISYTQGLIVAWLSYTLFTMYSGSRGVILTDTLMFLLFTGAAFFALVYLVQDQGGWPSVVTGLSSLDEKPGLISWHGVVGEGTEWLTPMDYLMWALIIDMAWSVVFAVSPWQSSRHLMARDEHVVLRASIYACLAVALLQVFLYAAGATVNLSNPGIEPAEQTMIWAARNLLPEFLGAVLLAGIMAAALSSASTFLSLIGFSANNDLFRRTQKDERVLIRQSRWSMLGIGAVALVIGLFFPPSLFWLTYFVGTVFASSWGPVAFMSVWSKRITAEAAFWGLISGFVFNVIPKFLDYMGWIDLPAYLDPILIGATVSLLVILFVSRRGVVSRQEQVYRMRLHRTPGDELNAQRLKQTLMAPAVLIASGMLIPFLYLNWHVRPYQAATGQLLQDGSIDLLTGEAMLALGWGVWLIPAGLLGWWVIRRSYRPRKF